MPTIRVIILLATLIFVFGIGSLVILLARGYRLDRKTGKVGGTGLLVANSVPNGAQIIIDGDVKSATDTTISLPPGLYEVEIRKEGFYPWKKTLSIQKEVVTLTNSYLFPIAPSLTALTFVGVDKATLSPDATKIVYSVQRETVSKDKVGSQTISKPVRREGLWVLDLVDLPLGFERAPRQITDSDPLQASWVWSPDSRQILLKEANSYYLLDTGNLPASTKTNVTATLASVLGDWEERSNQIKESQLKKTPAGFAKILENQAKSILFSPDENKVLYTATASAQVPEKLIPPVLGASTQKEDRTINPGQSYVYDIKEDRNFAIEAENCIPMSESVEIIKTEVLENFDKCIIGWFPTSSHLVIAKKEGVSIVEYDATNERAIWGSSYKAPFVFPFANTGRLLILTNLGANSSLPNLYSLSLR